MSKPAKTGKRNEVYMSFWFWSGDGKPLTRFTDFPVPEGMTARKAFDFIAAKIREQLPEEKEAQKHHE
jgi:hypothetical protein